KVFLHNRSKICTFKKIITNRMKRILSIDGGGIRGIIHGMFIAALEEKLKVLSKNPNAHISDYFDFFSGTSTGGILTSILLSPSDEDPTKPKFSAREALDLYQEHGTEIFSTSKMRKFLSRFGLLSEIYDSRVLERVLLNYFGDTKLSQLIKPCIMTAYNIELRKNHLLDRKSTRLNSSHVKISYA